MFWNYTRCPSGSDQATHGTFPGCLLSILFISQLWFLEMHKSCCASAFDFSNSVPIVHHLHRQDTLNSWLANGWPALCLNFSVLYLWGLSSCHFSHLQLKADFPNHLLYLGISLSDLMTFPHLILIVQCCRRGVRTVHILSLILP